MRGIYRSKENNLRKPRLLLVNMKEVCVTYSLFLHEYYFDTIQKCFVLCTLVNISDIILGINLSDNFLIAKSMFC